MSNTLTDLEKEVLHLREQRDHLQIKCTAQLVELRVLREKLAPVVTGDAVNHPKHYDHPSGVECMDIVRHLPFNLGNAVKYLWRAGRKDPAKTIEDYQKAVFYLKDESERMGVMRKSRPEFAEVIEVSIHPSLAVKGLLFRVQDGRDGNLEGLLRALFRLTISDSRTGAVTESSIQTSILFLEGAIAALGSEQP